MFFYLLGHDSLVEELNKLEEDKNSSLDALSSGSSFNLKKSSSSNTLRSSSPSPSNVSSDGFLRPSPRRCDLRKQRHLSVDFPIGGEPDLSSRRSKIIKRPSVDSGINLVSVETYKRASLDSGLDVLQKHARNLPMRASIASRPNNNNNIDDFLLSSLKFDPSE